MATIDDIGTPGAPLSTPPLTDWQEAVRDAIKAAQAALVPVGTVVAYGGAVAPEGWHLCDGTAHGSAELQTVLGSPNAPDLRNRFIAGAGSTFALGTSGGTTDHQHALDTNGQARVVIGSTQYLDMGRMGTTTWTPSHRQTLSGGSTTPGAGNDQTSGAALIGRTGNVNNNAWGDRPPFWALTYIIKKGAT